MKKNYQAPELERICLETKEPVTATLGIFSNLFPTAVALDEAKEENEEQQ